MITGASESSFDELAKGLASGSITRGRALRVAGGALLGAALASLPGVAWRTTIAGVSVAGAVGTPSAAPRTA